ncbi:MAG: DegV family protein [Anaerolineae bacterium]
MAEPSHRIAVITDSTSDLSPEVAAQNDVLIVPLYVIWGEDQLRDGVDITKEAFYERLANDAASPSTSQPTPGDFVDAYKRVMAQGAEEIVVITISDQLSGTYDSANAAALHVDVPVHVMDSFSTSMGLGMQVLAATQVRDSGGSAREMLAAAERVRQRIRVYFAVSTLEYLHRGGRIGGAAKLLGTVLQLKPLLVLDNKTGYIDAVERVRTWRKAMDRVYEVATDGLDPRRRVRSWVMHAAAPADAMALAERINVAYNPVSMGMGQLSPVLGTHVGPGTVGMVMYDDED